MKWLNSPIGPIGIALFFAISACTAGKAPEDADDRVSVVATTTIVADWVQQIGGDRVDVFVMLPEGVDPHSYVAGAQDVVRVSEADLVFAVGLMLEPARAIELVQNALGDSSALVELGGLVDPLPFEEIHVGDPINHILETIHEVEEGHLTGEDALAEIEDILAEEEETGNAHADDAEGLEAVHRVIEDVEAGSLTVMEALEVIEEQLGGHEEGGHSHGTLDPHFWFDPLRVKQAVSVIRDELAVLDPDNAETYRANAAAYSIGLDELHATIQEQVTLIPEARRVLVTSHDSFQYFARLYGFRIVGVVFPGGGTEEDPSAQEMADLVDAVRASAAPAVFAETTVRDRIVRAIADEADVTVVQTLYTGSLGPSGSGAETYLDMMHANAQTIVEALR